MWEKYIIYIYIYVDIVSLTDKLAFNNMMGKPKWTKS